MIPEFSKSKFLIEMNIECGLIELTAEFRF